MKKSRKVFKSFLILLCSLLMVSFVAYHLVPSPSKTTRSFFLHLKYERYDKAFELTAGQYRENRGPLERFASDYRSAIHAGTRTRNINIRGVDRASIPGAYVVHVTVKVLYRGDLIDTDGSYLVRNIPGKGWKIVQNVSNIVSKP